MVEELYAAGEAGRVPLPWSRTAPHPLLTEWTSRQRLRSTGRRAIVVACDHDADAEHLAALASTPSPSTSHPSRHVARQRNQG
jgi:hypothetical protein